MIQIVVFHGPNNISFVFLVHKVKWDPKAKAYLFWKVGRVVRSSKSETMAYSLFLQFLTKHGIFSAVRAYALTLID